VREPFNERIKQSTAVYLVMLLPFFLIGWGNYSNRFLLAPWVAVSFIVAAMVFYSRLTVVRNPVLLRGGLLVAAAVFCVYVTRQIMI
jgi:hypothetical protein